MAGADLCCPEEGGNPAADQTGEDIVQTEIKVILPGNVSAGEGFVMKLRRIEAS